MFKESRGVSICTDGGTVRGGTAAIIFIVPYLIITQIVYGHATSLFGFTFKILSLYEIYSCKPTSDLQPITWLEGLQDKSQFCNT